MRTQPGNTVQDRQVLYEGTSLAVQAQLEALTVLLQAHHDKAADGDFHRAFIDDVAEIRRRLNAILLPDPYA